MRALHSFVEALLCKMHYILYIVLVALTTPAAYAQRADDYPSKPSRMIVPFAPGGPPDVIGRPVVQKLSEVLGQPILFDNRPGAAGQIGTEAVAKSPRDGHTLVYPTGSHNPNSLVYRKLQSGAAPGHPPVAQ